MNQLKNGYQTNMCDLISLVANAVATNTEEEAIEYLNDVHFNSTEEAQQISHSIDVLIQITNKKTI